MEINKKEISKTEIEVTVELSVAELAPYLEQAAQVISQDLKIPGFRPGKVPYAVLKKKVPEAQIYEQAFYQAVNKTLPTIVRQEKIEFIGQPRIDALKIAPNNPLVFKATFALLPQVKLGDYRSFKARRQKVEPDQAKVEQTFIHLRELRATEKLVQRPAAAKDKVKIDFTVKQGKVVLEGGQAKDYAVVIGDHQFIPGFEEQLVGLTAGAAKNFVLTFPANYFQKNLAGRQCDFEVKVKGVYEVILPELNDQLAQSFNFKNLAEFKKQINDNIQKELEQKEKERLELALLEEIIERSQFDPLPSLLVEAEIDKMLHELKHQIEDSGGKLEDYLKSLKKTEADFRKEWQPQAAKRIKTALITRQIAQTEKIAATPEQIEKELAATLAQYQNQPDLKGQLDTPAYRQYLGNLLTNRQVFEFLTKFVG